MTTSDYCGRGPCCEPAGHPGPCNPGGDAPVRVWVERPITSVEDAEALPNGSLIFDELSPNAELLVPGGEDWHCDGWPHTLTDALRYARAGSTPYPVALVPVEAEEETLDMRTMCDPADKTIRRFVTPWEDA